MNSSFPPVDALIVKVKEIDYIKLTATFCAIVVGITSYVWTALQLWWSDNEEAVKVNSFKVIVNTIDFIAAVCIDIPQVYRWVKLNTNRAVDFVYFQVALG